MPNHRPDLAKPVVMRDMLADSRGTRGTRWWESRLIRSREDGGLGVGFALRRPRFERRFPGTARSKSYTSLEHTGVSWSPRSRRSALWAAVLPLIALALISAGRRAVALALQVEPFAWLYPYLPRIVVDDAHVLDSWFAARPSLTWIHILAGSLVMVLTPVQFVHSLRQRHIRFHRWTGRVTLLAAVPAALSGVLLQTQSPFGGVLALSAIVSAGVLFLGSGAQAYQAIRRGDETAHREWMIRFLVVGLGVGMVRLLALPLVLATGQRPLELAGIAFWLGFSIPVLAGEWFIRSTRTTRHPLVGSLSSP